MKKLFNFLTLALLCAAMLLVVSCNAEVTKETKWCSMVYMDMGDLVPDAILNLNEMTSSTVADQVKFFIITGGAKIAKDEEYTADYLNLNVTESMEEDEKKAIANLKALMADPTTNFADSAKKDTVQVWEVVNENGSKKIYLRDTLTGGSICDSVTFDEFLTYCNEQTGDSTDSYKRVLTMWGFGGGSYNGMLEDYSDETSTISISIADFASALRSSGVTMNIVNLDLSNMQGFEMAYALKGLANFVVGSQADASSVGMDYEAWTKVIAENPSIDDVTLAKKIAQTAFEKLDEKEQAVASWSVVDLRNAENSNSAFAQLENAWSEYLYNVVIPNVIDPTKKESTEETRDAFQTFLAGLREKDPKKNIFDNNMYDLKVFAEAFTEKYDSGDSNSYKANLESALKKAVTNYAGDSVADMSSGLSVCILRDGHILDKSTGETDDDPYEPQVLREKPLPPYTPDPWYNDLKAYCAVDGYKTFLRVFAETGAKGIPQDNDPE